MQNNQLKTNKKQFQNDWYFIPTLLSGFAGITIGVAIGNALGWI
ncbi:MAG: hypothetical protein QNJ34_22250 [Xenococcaceae cyanobacterium MO_188.B29]|nr:hypothetical protein [Xenococcaceae cyanobacterium MO_188.B29]